ncbi:hypothetical protein VNO77_07438 [Canavalia gladiata]|uniref:Autophagy-related protein 2 n=1 Tax=Canavalia gladiata TaxID=3824 RepID=A0AAN9MD60_CANGL
MMIRCCCRWSLYWFDTISSFFNFLTPNTNASDTSVLKEEQKLSYTSSFVLSLIDAALSYESYMKNLEAQKEVLNSESGYSSVKGDMNEPFVSWLLASSSLTLSNSSSVDTVEMLNIFKKTGYVKIAQEAFREVTLKINGANGLLWELESSKSHLYMETCHDITATLIHMLKLPLIETSRIMLLEVSGMVRKFANVLETTLEIHKHLQQLQATIHIHCKVISQKVPQSDERLHLESQHEDDAYINSEFTADFHQLLNGYSDVELNDVHMPDIGGYKLLKEWASLISFLTIGQQWASLIPFLIPVLRSASPQIRPCY